MDQKKIGKFIAELRTEKDLTQTELGEMLGVSYKAVSKWENGICLPDASLYDDICKIFKIQSGGRAGYRVRAETVYTALYK